jgi:hypothetical protein
MVSEGRATAPAAHEVPLRVEGLPWLRWRHAGDHRSQVGEESPVCQQPAAICLLCSRLPGPGVPYLQTMATWRLPTGLHRTVASATPCSVLCSNFEDTEDASLDPEPIMVTEAEQDAALSAILDQNIGIGANGWDPKLERR